MKRPSPALIFALVGLFVASGGAAMAASHYLISSTHQISPKLLRQLRGPRGQRGPAGPRGAAGAGGPVKLIYVNKSIPYQGGSTATGTLSCPSGSLPLAASGVVTTNTELNIATGPKNFMFTVGTDSVANGTATVYGVCASGPGLSQVSQPFNSTTGQPPNSNMRSAGAAIAQLRARIAKLIPAHRQR